jgi:hypothetical protein
MESDEEIRRVPEELVLELANGPFTSRRGVGGGCRMCSPTEKDHRHLKRCEICCCYRIKLTPIVLPNELPNP